MGPIIAARFRNHAHTLVSNDAGKRFMMAYLQVVNEEQPPINIINQASLRQSQMEKTHLCQWVWEITGLLTVMFAQTMDVFTDFLGMAIQKLVIRTCMPWDTWDITSISENSAT